MSEFREERKQAEAEATPGGIWGKGAIGRHECCRSGAVRIGKPEDREFFRKPETSDNRSVAGPIVPPHDSVIDGKAVKASYNAGVKEHIVHVTEIRKNENGDRSRFIIGARPTETGRNGERGAAVRISESLTPLPGNRVIVVSGDAGFRVGEFCGWLNGNGFFLTLPDKRELR